MADRRQTGDRRRRWGRHRRSKGDQRVFVLELSSNDLGVVELRRTNAGVDEVTSTAAEWRLNAASLTSEEGRAELTAAFREVARRHGMHGAEIRVVLSGEFCVMRTFRGTVESVRAELQRLEQRSRMYLSLGPGEKVLVSNTQALDARHAHALAAVCNEATLESIQAAADAAGLEISVIEPSLAALCRAVTRLAETPTGSYLVVNINPSGVELGVCHEGQLLLDYRPGGRAAVGDLPALLETHLNRLSRHIGRCLHTAPPELKRIYMCGDPAAVQAAIVQFKRRSTLEVRHVRPVDVKATWDISRDSASEVTAAALGSLLAAYLPGGDADAPNLMQHIIDCKREPLRPVLIRSAVPIAATLLAIATLIVVNARQDQTLRRMQTEVDQLAVAQARATELRLQMLSARGKLVQLEKLSTELPGELGDELVKQLAGCMPSDVWLSRVEVLDRASIKLSGASYLEAGVYDFVRWLEQAPGFAEVALKGTSPGSSPTGPTTSFELELSLAKTGVRSQESGVSQVASYAALAPIPKTPVADAPGSPFPKR